MNDISDIQLVAEQTAEEICDKFCKFSGTGKDGHCVWCQIHEDNCPLDKLLKVVELK
jgi:hypothetical protein